MDRIASRKYVDGAKGQPCRLRIAGIRTGGGDDTIFAHIRDRHTGRSIKASDISGADACFACHTKFDGQSGEPLSQEEWLFYALRGLQETLENRIARGLMIVQQDIKRPPRASAERPKKAPAASRPIPSRDFPKGTPRPIPSRPFRTKEKA